MSIIIKNISYIHPNSEILFQEVNFSISKGEKAALLGNNGVGKSTLLQIISGLSTPSSGEVVASGSIYHVTQHTGQYDFLSIAQTLNIDKKLIALQAILQGKTEAEHFAVLDDDWSIEERALAALEEWNLHGISLSQQLGTLSGGEKTKVFLAGITIHEPTFILFDEPTNHLDLKSRLKLYDLIQRISSGILVVSHDRTLLNMLPVTHELTRKGINTYGGNYEFYKSQKEEQQQNLQDQIKEKEKFIRKTKKIAQETAEKRQKQESRGGKKSEQSGTPRIMMKTLKNSAEGTTSKLKEAHMEKREKAYEELQQIRQQMPDLQKLRLTLENTSAHKGKILCAVHDLLFSYDKTPLWKQPLNFHIVSGDRWAIQGDNGTGKTTLLKLILGELDAPVGKITRTDFQYMYIDQEYSIINQDMTVLEQVQAFNSRHLQDHELKIMLHQFLFPVHAWNKKCVFLSGGEKMKLLLCCLMVSLQAPDVFVLDEPTNNLDIQSLTIFTGVLKNYNGTIILVSHDTYFMREIGITQNLILQ